MTVKIKRINEKIDFPKYETSGSAGCDLRASIDDELVIMPHTTVMIPSGIAVAIPDGYAGLVCARSGVASKRDLAPANKVGVIDSDYRGEIIVALHNHGQLPRTVLPCERIAQLLIVPVIQAEFEEGELEDTNRGAGGFGSTGK